MEAWSTSPKGGLGVEPKCIAGIYSSTHIALDATQDKKTICADRHMT